MIAAVMGVLLLVSVGVAGWISHSRQAASDRGGDIMAEIRQAGLPHFWGEGTREFYLMRHNGETVGWRAVLRRPVGDGYRGFDMHATAEGATAWESWTLHNDLRSGTYVAFGPSSTVRGLLAKTEITFTAGQIEVTETLLALAGGGRASRPGLPPRPGPSPRLEAVDRHTSRTDVGDNYLPEGSLPLVARRVGEHKANASFKIVMNGTPPLQTARGELTTRLSSVRVEFNGTEMLQDPPLEPATVVSMARGGFGHEDAERTFWSRSGELRRIAFDQSDMVRVSQQELQRVFPKAMEELTTLSNSAEIGYEEEKNDDAETETSNDQAEGDV